MPISANKLIYDLRRKVNAIDSGRSKDYRIVDLVSFINDAYSIIISHLIQEKDENETIRNHLRPQMVVNKKLKCKKTNDCNICEIIYPDNFYELINIRSEVCKDCCKGTKKFEVLKPQGDDIDVASRNPYRQANYYFEQLLCYETNKGLRFYHNNEMDILSIEIDYYRKIKGIEAPKLVECEDHIYKNWDGELIKNNVDFEIDSTYLANKVTDVAAALMNNASTNFVGFNEKLKEILQINQLHK
jgi:hypothetical protein